MDSMRSFWAWCAEKSRRYRHDSDRNLEKGYDAPPPYSFLPLNAAVEDKIPRFGGEVEEPGVEKQIRRIKLAIARKGCRFVYEIKKSMRLCRYITSELGWKTLERRREQFRDLLQLCMAQDYLLPTSSSTAVIESWGLNGRVKLADWEHLRGGFKTVRSTPTSWRYSMSLAASFHVLYPADTLGLDLELIWARLYRVDEAATLCTKPSPWNYIEWHIRQGMWDHVAAKIVHDRDISLRALFKDRRSPCDIKRHRRIYTALCEAIKAVESRYFVKLISEDDYILSEYAVALCNDSIHYYLPLQPAVRQELDAYQQGKPERQSIMEERPMVAGLEDIDENQERKSTYSRRRSI
ncbi:hypothetical protein MMC11_001087 [Xylographa trunciseda]|nr:hypothetical protein [Xylographa trunciseda]